MSNTESLLGAVLICGDEDIAAVMTLLNAQVTVPVRYAHYHAPTELNFDRQYDFIVLSRLPCLKETSKLYQEHGKAIPLVIHLVHPRLINEIDYADLFPEIPQIIPIPQASLDVMDITLKYDIFRQVLEKLQAARDEE